jgi:hypothetical protein
MISDLQTRKLDRAIGHLDIDGDGTIEWEDWIELATRITAAFGQSPATPKGAQVVSAFEQLWQSLLSNLDIDGDRRIRPAEWRAGMTSAFITDRDGYVANFRPAAQAVFGLADTDADGQLSKDEFARFQRAFHTQEQDIEAAFNHLDANGSGSLSVNELVTAAEQYYRGADPDAHGNWLYGPIT